MSENKENAPGKTNKWINDDSNQRINDKPWFYYCTCGCQQHQKLPEFNVSWKVGNHQHSENLNDNKSVCQKRAINFENIRNSWRGQESVSAVNNTNQTSMSQNPFHAK